MAGLSNDFQPHITLAVWGSLSDLDRSVSPLPLVSCAHWMRLLTTTTTTMQRFFMWCYLLSILAVLLVPRVLALLPPKRRHCRDQVTLPHPAVCFNLPPGHLQAAIARAAILQPLTPRGSSPNWQHLLLPSHLSNRVASTVGMIPCPVRAHICPISRPQDACRFNERPLVGSRTVPRSSLLPVASRTPPASAAFRTPSPSAASRSTLPPAAPPLQWTFVCETEEWRGEEGLPVQNCYRGRDMVLRRSSAVLKGHQIRRPAVPSNLVPRGTVVISDAPPPIPEPRQSSRVTIDALLNPQD